jgi:hypothetical protein
MVETRTKKKPTKKTVKKSPKKSFPKMEQHIVTKGKMNGKNVNIIVYEPAKTKYKKDNVMKHLENIRERMLKYYPESNAMVNIKYDQMGWRSSSQGMKPIQDYTFSMPLEYDNGFGDILQYEIIFN